VVAGLGLLVGVNALAAMHARSFLYFGPPGERTTSPESIGPIEAAKVLVTGPTLPRPVERTDPLRALGRPFVEHTVESADGTRLASWSLASDLEDSVGTAILLHGYGGCRDELLGVADWFLRRGWRVELPAFRGAGASEGDHTTLGWHEAEDVDAIARFVRSEHDGPVIAYGFSMGAVAAIGAAGRLDAPLDAVIAEAPYASLVDTVGQRFALLGLPTTPGAELLVGWGSVWTGFDAFSLRPVDHAAGVQVPTLVLSGADDQRAPPADGAAIAAGIPVHGRHVVLEDTGHQLGLSTRPQRWSAEVDRLLRQVR